MRATGRERFAVNVYKDDKRRRSLPMKQDLIVILDLGSTQNTVIAREIRDLGVYSEDSSP